MLDKTILNKIVQDERFSSESGYFKAASFLDPKTVRVLDGIIIARANELGYDYNQLFDYVTSLESEQLCVSAVKGITEIDYSKLPN